MTDDDQASEPRRGGRRPGGRTLVTNEQVYQCIVDLVTGNPRRTATRQVIASELQVPYALVDEHIDRLLDKGRIRRVVPGVFEPSKVWPDKVIGTLVLPDGRVKLEIDDLVLEPTRRDVRNILYCLGGFALNCQRMDVLRRISESKRYGQDREE